MKYWKYIALFSWVVWSCKKSDTTPVDFEYDYFQIVKGRYCTYSVLEIHHDTTATIQHDTLRYQLKVLIGDTILDLENEVANRYYRYTRDSSNHPWVEKDLWTTKISHQRAELVEENRRMIKMVFKPTSDKSWNMNAFNDLDEQKCSYGSIDVAYDINGMHFDKAAVVQEADFTSLVDYQKAYSVYVRGVGLVKKYYKWLTIYDFDSTKVNQGTEIYYDLTGYGTE